MARDFRIKTSSGQVDIPETAGKLHIKTASGTQTQINSLYVKTDAAATAPGLVWQAGTTSATCDVCQPTVENNKHWPQIPSLGTRWDCAQWSNTANVQISGSATPISDSLVGGNYANIYDLVSPEPPPPGYIVLDYATFTIKDAFTIFNNSLLTTSGSYIRTQTHGGSGNFCGNYFPNYSDTGFNTSHGGGSSTFYYVKCDLQPAPLYFSCSLFNFDPKWLNPESGPKTCCGTCVSNTGGGIQALPGDSCIPIADVITNSTSDAVKNSVLIDIACVGTSLNYPTSCKSKCYGFGYAPNLSGINDPVKMCRTVARVPNSIGSAVHGFNYDLSPNNQTYCSLVRDFYHSKFKFNNLAEIGTPKCDCDGCANNDCSQCGSAWFSRMFTPFYVYLPNTKYDLSGTNLLGKYIELTLDFNDLDPAYLTNWKKPNNTSFPYNNNPILKTIKSLLDGTISSCGITMGFPISDDLSFPVEGDQKLLDTADTKDIIWTLTEYPKQISTGVPSHTHQVVIEYWQGASACSGFCHSTTNSDFSNIKGIRLYPITDSSGNMSSKVFYNFINQTLSTSAYGIKDFNSVRWYFNPLRGINNSTFGGDGAGLFSNAINPQSLTNFAIAKQNALFVDSSDTTTPKKSAYRTNFDIAGTAVTRNLENTAQQSSSSGILKNILDTIQQPTYTGT